MSCLSSNVKFYLSDNEVSAALDKIIKSIEWANYIETFLYFFARLPEDNVYSLFGESPIGIFPADYKSTAKDDPVNIPTWRRLVNEEIKFTVTHPPKNYFEEMIQWTEQGKLWLFPIDNEQGIVM